MGFTKATQIKKIHFVWQAGLNLFNFKQILEKPQKSWAI